MYQIIFYVPEDYCQPVKSAMFEAGAGKMGDYDQCAWQVKGRGQFRPLKGSNAFIGDIDTLSQVTEYRVEMVSEKRCIKAVIQALIAAHPYQTPAYSVFEAKQLEDF
ncbi:NGG1p interacting factor NIF3 [Psychromonas sp. psych-6C06]|uniref:NGG1p interacting factor NIF3 n=1 Tax=Psychromonas sp. psych-6C06 TaxID=2058089 RepID=UPI000C344B7F|nr:NGG1p interacting factor NIF3 [Psychromonas sp. psych-6C06]PKF62786.1 NGG1p interacting factor NIF3 [Psychromonas sp. psych-6C06]